MKTGRWPNGYLFSARTIGIILAMCLLVPPLHAAAWQAIQGDVVTVRLQAEGDKPSLSCFGLSWPVQADGPGHWLGWIGIDLKQRPGSYRVLWKNSRSKSAQRLQISKGKFRISHIQVEKKMAVFDKPTLARIRSEVKKLKATYTLLVDANPAIRMTGIPVKGIVSTPFGAQRYVNGEARSPHSGIDIAAPAGTPIRAPLSGKVLLVEDMYLNGNTVAIGHGNGLVSVYSHMQSTLVHSGDWIDRGTMIGRVGASGRATGPHLHWGVRFNNARINPFSLLPRQTVSTP